MPTAHNLPQIYGRRKDAKCESLKTNSLRLAEAIRKKQTDLKRSAKRQVDQGLLFDLVRLG